jgi:hypothetical protein
MTLRMNRFMSAGLDAAPPASSESSAISPPERKHAWRAASTTASHSATENWPSLSARRRSPVEVKARTCADRARDICAGVGSMTGFAPVEASGMLTSAAVAMVLRGMAPDRRARMEAWSSAGRMGRFWCEGVVSCG